MACCGLVLVLVFPALRGGAPLPGMLFSGIVTRIQAARLTVQHLLHAASGSSKAMHADERHVKRKLDPQQAADINSSSQAGPTLQRYDPGSQRFDGFHNQACTHVCCADRDWCIVAELQRVKDHYIPFKDQFKIKVRMQSHMHYSLAVWHGKHTSHLLGWGIVAELHHLNDHYTTGRKSAQLCAHAQHLYVSCLRSAATSSVAVPACM